MLVSCEKSLYNYIIRIPFFATLDIVASTIPLNMKYHNICDKPIIFHVDLTRAHQIHEALLIDPIAKIFQQKKGKVKRQFF